MTETREMTVEEREEAASSVAKAEEFFELVRGDTLDHFLVEEPLGRGGMGAVYRARDLSLDRTVAIKLLPAQYAAQPELKQRFLREARAQARLQSPWVVQIYFVGETPPDARERRSLYFAMQLVEGGSLEEHLDSDETMAPEDARRAMVQTARALLAAQQAGIIHRDIKPGNLLYDKEGNIKVADFGLAKPVDEGGNRLTQAGTVVGSPHYMSPEQAMGDESLDFRSDMYALGCTFFHLLTGKPPYDATSPFAIVSQHVQAEVPEIKEHRAEVPLPLARIIRQLMNKAPDERYGSYEELIEALELAAPKKQARPSFAARGLAFFLDLVLGATTVGLIGWPGVIVYLTYVTLGHGIWGQTLGKKMLQLQVKRQDGEPLGIPRSLGRTMASLWLPLLVGTVVTLTQGTGALVDVIDGMKPTEVDAFRSWLVAFAISNGVLSLLYAVGMLMAIFHPSGKAVHDLVVGSEVVYKLDD